MASFEQKNVKNSPDKTPIVSILDSSSSSPSKKLLRKLTMMPNKKLDNTPAESIQDSALSSPSHKLLRQLTKMPKKKLILDNKITK